MNTDRFKFRVWDNNFGEYIDEGALLNGSTGKIAGTGNYTIEQCTGIRDKNRKLIYEGDYIRFPHSTLKGPVRWCECFGAWVVKCKGRREMFFDPGWEIIGNIHEEERKNEN